MRRESGPHFEAQSIHLWRGERHLLKGVSFVLKAGELLQLVGPNGVGKTSLLRAACGLLPVESGVFSWRSRSIEKDRSEFQSALVYLAHANALKGDLTARENLRYELSLRGAVSDGHIDQQLDQLGIGQCAELPARVLSAGQRRRLALARIVLTKASLWVLDEPTTNLDTAGIAMVEQLMASHLQGGGSILTAAHHRLLAEYPGARTLELAA